MVDVCFGKSTILDMWNRHGNNLIVSDYSGSSTRTFNTVAPLLTWFNFNPSLEKLLHPYYKMWDEMTYPFLNFNGATVEV